MPPVSRVVPVLVVGVVAVSLAAIFVRYADAPGVVVAAYRMVIASLVLLPVSVMALRHTPPTRRTALYAVLAGLCLAVHFATWITSLSYTTVAASVAIVSSQALWVALFSWWFLGLAPSFMVLVGIMLAIAGGALIGFGDFFGGSAPLLGDGLALIGAISAALYFLLGRAAQRQGLGLHAYTGLAYSVAALLLLPLPALFGYSYFSYSNEMFVWVLLLALIPQLLGHTSINYAMKHLNPTLVATVALLEPVGAGVLALLLFQEVPKGLTLLGAAILLMGVLIVSYNSRSHPPIKPSES